ncbi:MAG: methyltransferase [Acinetobacter sp.]|nr:methyltransferase [Acinetobacter sp.]
MDTVLLAAACKITDGQTLLDVGCGVGSAGLCVALKKQNILLNGIDIYQENIALARENAKLNGLTESCTFYCNSILQDFDNKDNFFDFVITNPPYQAGGKHSPSPDTHKSLAHGEDASGVDLKEWCKYLHKKLKQGGSMVMVHRADRLDEIIRALTERRWFGSLVILPVHSRIGEPAKRVLISARKERYAPLVIKPALIMHEADGSYTQRAAAILDGNAAIDL